MIAVFHDDSTFRENNSAYSVLVRHLRFVL
jgi:hypothetical protein